MNKFIEQKIIELQNSKTATEITQNAKYFINILAENERLTKQLKNSVVLPCKVGDTIYYIREANFKNPNNPIIEVGKVEKIIIANNGMRLKLDINAVYENSVSSIGKSLFFDKAEALARLAELGGKE